MENKLTYDFIKSNGNEIDVEIIKLFSIGDVKDLLDDEQIEDIECGFIDQLAINQDNNMLETVVEYDWSLMAISKGKYRIHRFDFDFEFEMKEEDLSTYFKLI
ncbi:hypothetical protein D3C71_1116400 [compost metagenome]